MKRNSWLDRYSYKLFPNVYVILISAKSGLRKGNPVSLAEGLVRKTGNTRVIAGANTVEGIIKELSQQRTVDNVVYSEAQAFLCAPELKAYLVSSETALDTMVDLYDTHARDKYEKMLKNSPLESLKNPYITLLGASNEVLFNELVQKKDIEGGFIARSFIIYESKRRTVNSLAYKPSKFIPKETLVDYLKQIAALPEGEFTWDAEARNYYDIWYKKLCKISDSHEDRTGTLERLGDSCLKLAMIISISKRLTREILLEDLEEAVIKCEEYFVLGTKRISMGNGNSELSKPAMLLIKTLLVSPDNTIERTQLLKKLWPDVDSVTLDKVYDTLGESSGQGILRAFRDIDRKICYQLKPEFVDQYKSFQEEEKS